MDFYTVEPCATSNAFEVRFRNNARLDLARAEKALSRLGQVLARTEVVLVLKCDDCSASFYASGRIMLKGVSRQEAQALGKKYSAALEKGGAFV
jgi:hypothetical protein